MQIQNNSKKKRILDKALIIMAIITITMAFLLISTIVLKNTEIQILKQKSDVIKESYSATENNTWDISENGDESVGATLSEDGILTISGTGKMKDWDNFDITDWHGMKDKVKSVIIEDGVTNIGMFAFQGCINITNIKIPKSVTSIGEVSFGTCTSLTNIIIPDSVISIGTSAFSKCTSLDNIVMPNSVTSIEGAMFANCASLTSIEIPNSVRSIGAMAFMGCTSLTSIEIPDSVTNIERFAFEGCTGIISIEIPSGVTNIDDGPFMGCTSLKSIKMPNSLKSIGYCAFSGCTSLTDIEIPESVTNIGELAFDRCTSLTNIEIPNSVTSIDCRAFEGCTSLTSIDVDKDNKNYMDYNGVLYTKDGSEIIRYPEGRKETKYTLLSGVTGIGRYAFYGCIDLNSIEIPNSVTSIEDCAFMRCTGLMSMDIPNSVTNIEHNVFVTCPNLANIVMPNSVTSFGIGVFIGCPNLKIYCKSDSNAKQYAINNNIKYVIDDEAPTITSINGNPTSWTKEKVTLTINGANDSVVGLAEKTFSFDGGETWQAENTKTYTENTAGIIIKVKDKLDNIYTHETIDITKMYKQSAIENTTWDISENEDGSVVATLSDDGILIISGTGKMKDWESNNTIDWYEIKDEVNSVIIEEGVTSIGEYAFFRCTNLTSIEIPNSVMSIGERAFYECTSLINIVVPDSIANIGHYVFNGCTSLTSIEIPNSVASIGDYVFDGCTSLTSIRIPESVTSIGMYAFSRCRSLIRIEIPNSVTSIGGYAIYGCTSLTSIEIPNSVTSIGNHVFERCTSLTDIEVNEDNKNYMDDNGILYTKDGNEIIKYPEGKKETIYAILTGTKSVSDDAFYGCTSLTSIEIPNSVTSIGYSAFKECTSLTSVKIPDKVTNIRGFTFSRCSSLINIEIPNSVTDIGYFAFEGCTSLKNIIIPDSVITIGDRPFEGCSNLTIYCTSDSYAKEYAINNRVKYVVDDEGPTMTNIEENPTSWTKGNVTLTINAEDSLAGLAKKAYSFDGGETWQTENSKTYTENTDGIVIKVKDKLDNINTHETINITKIDRVRPTITSVTGNPTQLTEEDVTLTISAYDNLSGLEAYSFDGGETWQTENTKTYTENTSGIIIAVKDQAGNVATYGETIKIDKINRLNVKLELYEEQKEENNTFITNIKQKTSIKEFVTNIKTNGTIEIYQGTEKITNTDTKIGTGMIVKITLNETQREYTTVIKGDTNGDGKTDIQDIFAINKHRLNNGILTNAYLLAGDTNKDGKININDIFRINKYRLGMITEL